MLPLIVLGPPINLLPAQEAIGPYDLPIPDAVDAPSVDLTRWTLEEEPTELTEDSIPSPGDEPSKPGRRWWPGQRQQDRVTPEHEHGPEHETSPIPDPERWSLSESPEISIPGGGAFRLVPPVSRRSWDNVEDAPTWLGGCRPAYQPRLRLHTVTLAPGATSKVMLPAGGFLRVVRPHGELTPHDLQLWISNGSGVFREHQGAMTEGVSELITASDSPDPAVAYIERPKGATGSLEVALFVSRMDHPVELTPPRQLPIESCTPVQVTRVRDGWEQQYVALPKGQWHRVKFEDAGVLQIETRLRYSAWEARREQTYEVLVRGPSDFFRVVDFESTSDTRTLYQVDGTCEVLGYERTECVSVPAGATELEIYATADVLLRAVATPRCGCVEAGATAPCGQTCQLRSGMWLGRHSLWDWSESDIMGMLRQPDQGLSTATLYRIARDNEYRSGGLSSLAIARGEVARTHELPRAESLREQIQGMHTGYRHILPRVDQPIDQQFSWFYARTPARIDLPPSEHVLHEDHVEEAIDRLVSGGTFVPVPTLQAGPLVYALPVEVAPSTVRLAFDRRQLTGCAYVMVQLDQGTPIRLCVRTEPDLDPGRMEASLGEIALAGLHQLHGDTDIGTLGGPFGASRTPALTIPAATTTLAVSRGTHAIRVWQETESDVAVTLHVRRSNVFELTEQAFLELVRLQGLEDGCWPQMMRPRQEIADDELAARFSFRELHNHWQPLQVFLRSRERLMESTSEDIRSTTAAMPWQQVRSTFERAGQFEELEDWTNALEAWSSLVDIPRPEVHYAAVQGQLKALVQLGETWLLESTARGIVLFDPDADTRQVAVEALHRLYEQSGDTDAWETLTATLAIREGTTQRLTELAEALRENGRYEYALLVALSLPESERPRELLVQCAFQLRWWLLFQLSVDQLEDPKQKDFWTGLWHVQAGRSVAALRRFEQSGELGEEYARHLRQGRATLRMIRSRDLATRAQGIWSWESWWATHPGARTWYEDQTIVQTSHGGTLVREVGRDILTTYHDASASRPTTIRVQGPARIRFEARPVHQAQHITSLTDWLNVRSETQHFVFPMRSAHPSPTLRLVGEGDDLPGLKNYAIVRVGAGHHEFHVEASHGNMLVRVFVEGPALPLPVLPRINSVTMEAAIAGAWHTAGATQFGYQDHAMTLIGKTKWNQPPIVYTQPALQLPPRPTALDARTAARLSLRAPWQFENAFSTPSETYRELGISSELDWSERLLALHRADDPETLDRIVLDPAAGIPGGLRDAYLTATGRAELAVAMASARDNASNGKSFATPLQNLATQASNLRQASLLAYLTETVSPAAADWVLQGAAISLRELRTAPWKDGDRFLARIHWERLDYVRSSAGVYSERLKGWHPESPILRARRAMMLHSLGTSHLLFGHAPLILSSQSPRDSVLELELEVVPLRYRPTTDADVELEVQGESKRTIRVRPGVIVREKIALANGAQSIRLQLPFPVAGQFVRLSIRDPNGDRLANEALEAHDDRTYLVATHDAPIEWDVTGPALLRIDEKQGGTTESRYLYIDRGTRQLSVSPSRGATRGLFRIFAATCDWQGRADNFTSAPVMVERLAPTLAGTIDLPLDEMHAGDIQLSSYQSPAEVGVLTLLPADAPSVVLSPIDVEPLGGQEDGTWEIGAGWTRRRSLDESPAESGVDQFAQFAISHQLFDDVNQRYVRNEGILRGRENSGATIAFLHEGIQQLPNSTWDLQWNGAFYTQRPESLLSDDMGDQEWLVDGRLRLFRRSQLRSQWFHTPSVTLFGRELSMTENPYGAERVDQDLFTRYKHDHRAGLILSDRLSWESSWNDRWWVRPLVATNEDFNPFNPDYVGLHFGWQHMWYGLDWDLSYRVAEYLRDQDRSRDITQHLLLADIQFHHWTIAGRRVEVQGRLQHDLGDGRTGGNVFVSLFLDRGRQYRDYHPSQIRFLQQRQHRADWQTAHLYDK